MQLQQQAQVGRALETLNPLGISACSMPVSRLADEKMPGWADPSAGGWFLMIEEARLQEALDEIGRLSRHREQ
jgi:hypothetical protein